MMLVLLESECMRDGMQAIGADSAFWRNEPTLQKHNSRCAELAGLRPLMVGALLFPCYLQERVVLQALCTRSWCSVPARPRRIKKPAAGVFSRAAPWTSLPHTGNIRKCGRGQRPARGRAAVAPSPH